MEFRHLWVSIFNFFFLIEVGSEKGSEAQVEFVWIPAGEGGCAGPSCVPRAAVFKALIPQHTALHTDPALLPNLFSHTQILSRPSELSHPDKSRFTPLLAGIK